MCTGKHKVYNKESQGSQGFLRLSGVFYTGRSLALTTPPALWSAIHVLFPRRTNALRSRIIMAALRLCMRPWCWHCLRVCCQPTAAAAGPPTRTSDRVSSTSQSSCSKTAVVRLVIWHCRSCHRLCQTVLVRRAVRRSVAKVHTAAVRQLNVHAPPPHLPLPAAAAPPPLRPHYAQQ